jgi:DnaJ family protein B protein 4
MFFHPPPSNQKNLYGILGIDSNASSTEIKSAYRKLSLQFHPDRNKSPDAQSVFQEIGEAYEILSDPDKKRHYDMEQQGGDLNDIINMMFSANGLHSQQRMPPGGSFPGTGQGIRIFSTQGGPFPPENFFQRPQKPERIQKKINITLEEAYNGCSVPVNIERIVVRGDTQTKENETVYVTVPPGIDTNETITLSEKGHCLNDMMKGDVRLVVQVTNSTPFVRNGLDLIFKKTITLKEALLGFTFDLQHVNGKIFTFNNTSQIIHPLCRRKIPDLGIIRENSRGHLWIDFTIQFPETLTETQMTTLKEIL